MHTILLSLSIIIDGKLTNKSRVHGAPNTSFLKEHGFTVNYPPVGFINAFMPKMNQKKNFREKTPYSLSVKNMCIWSNEKSGLMGMGGCKFYPTLQHFSVDEFENHLYMYYFNGLNPSPRVQMKLRYPNQYPVHGSTFIHRVFGPAASLCHNQWKYCFVIVYRIVMKNKSSE